MRTKVEKENAYEYTFVKAMKPLVSIVTITYNHEKYIEKCIEGVLSQIMNFPIEFIIAEDCSTDNTRAICEEYARKNPSIITLITSSENVGALANERRAIESAQGKYIALCEGDDYWTDPLKLQKQVDFLETHPDYSVCFHNRMIESKEGISFKDEFRHFCSPGEPGFELTFDLFYNHWVTFPFTMVFRRDAFDINWYARYKLFRDSHMIFHFLQRGRAYIFSFVGGVRTIHNDSMYHVMDSLQCAKTDMLVYNELFSANKSSPQGRELKKAYSNRIQCYINMAVKDKRDRLGCVLLSFQTLFLNHSLKCFGKNIFAIIK